MEHITHINAQYNKTIELISSSPESEIARAENIREVEAQTRSLLGALQSLENFLMDEWHRETRHDKVALSQEIACLEEQLKIKSAAIAQRGESMRKWSEELAALQKEGEEVLLSRLWPWSKGFYEIDLVARIYGGVVCFRDIAVRW
ncbi:uncharacterized protein VTP21DRAFT_4305 [Calcarisporiella thermophila]|uniref:uncharacterized protein n=1 Tax=Calcarisporiella thermophila TaxID=911321 RepID=UPI0037433DA5